MAPSKCLRTFYSYDPAEFDFRYCVHEGKQDLEKHLKNRIKYWKTPETVFVVMRVQESGDCLAIKRKLKAECEAAGRPDAIIRIACHENVLYKTLCQLPRIGGPDAK
jgi:ketosteroid isomerase-like protein